MAKILHVVTATTELPMIVPDDYEIPSPNSHGWFVFNGERSALSVHGHQIVYISLRDWK